MTRRLPRTPSGSFTCCSHGLSGVTGVADCSALPTGVWLAMASQRTPSDTARYLDWVTDSVDKLAKMNDWLSSNLAEILGAQARMEARLSVVESDLVSRTIADRAARERGRAKAFDIQ